MSGDPFKQKSKKADLKESAELENSVDISSEPVVETPKPTPAAPVDISKFSKDEAKAHIAKQFLAKIPVFVVALDVGEHPKANWKKAGDKFKLEKPEAYSHRWMKLA